METICIWIMRLFVLIGLFYMLFRILYKNDKVRKSCKEEMLDGYRIVDFSH